MRPTYLALVLTLNMLTPRLARAHCEEPQGFHEYAIFGDGPFYLYHYPAFGSIHAYEIVEEVSLLDPSGKDIGSDFVAAQLANPGKLFTISPLNLTDGTDAYWVLPSYTRKHAHFTAHLHYRNAQGQDADAIKALQVVVKDVAVDQLLKTPFTRPANLTYTYVQTRDAGFLIHKLVWDPDFNQVIKVKPLAEAGPCLMHGAAEVTVTGTPEGEANRLKAGTGGIHATVCGQSVQLSTEEQLFEFKGDLEH